jgi:transcriptional regulator GlxA family with amidase domain
MPKQVESPVSLGVCQPVPLDGLRKLVEDEGMGEHWPSFLGFDALSQRTSSLTIDRNANIRKNAAMSHRVAVVVLNEVSPFEMAVPCEVFGVDRSELASPWYDFRLCAGEESPIRTATGFTIETQWGLETLEWADTVIVAPTAKRSYPDELLAALRRAHVRGVRLVSICTGAFVLAAAGLLDGRRVTTHWMQADEMAGAYPDVTVDPNVLYIDDGDIATSAGTASGIDLCLHLVRKDHGSDVANAVAKRMVVPPHREGGQAQYIEYPMVSADESDLLDETLVWARDRLAETLTVEELADHAAMSPRTFARRFRDATGTTPHQWLTNERVRLAQRLLETTDRSIDWIATDAGFGTATNMRQHFSRSVGVPPGRYRDTFRRSQVA